MKSPRISSHTADWCHLCGTRADQLADISWAENAEHSRRFGDREALAAGRYLRMCAECAERVVAAARDSTGSSDVYDP